MSSVLVLDKIYFWNTKTFKIPTKVDNYTKDSVMGLNDNNRQPGRIKINTDVNYEQEPK